MPEQPRDKSRGKAQAWQQFNANFNAHARVNPTVEAMQKKMLDQIMLQ